MAVVVVRIIVLELVWDNAYSCERVKAPGPHSVSRCQVLACRSPSGNIPCQLKPDVRARKNKRKYLRSLDACVENVDFGKG